MSRRSFRLETVLRVRKAQEETARAELARENGEVRAAAAERDSAAERYRQVPVSSGAVAATVFQREAATADLAAASLLDARSHLSLAEAEAAVALRRWREAAQRVEALERLALRRLEEARAEEARHESAAVDDLVTARYIAAGQEQDRAEHDRAEHDRAELDRAEQGRAEQDRPSRPEDRP
jgi:flagellar export protein FliJ